MSTKIIPITPAQAAQDFDRKILCPQQTSRFAARLCGVDEELVSDSLLAFARGMGDRTRTCGCIVGSLAGIGLMLRGRPAEERMPKLRELQADFEKDFKAAFGGITCESIYTDRPHCCEIIAWCTQQLADIHEELSQS